MYGYLLVRVLMKDEKQKKKLFLLIRENVFIYLPYWLNVIFFPFSDTFPLKNVVC
jgi:hypothetical protein